MTEFETKDSGERQRWESGMQRDVQVGKPRFALMWTKRQPYEDQMVTRYAKLLARGAEKYDDRNWEEGSGQVELDYAYESLGRHTAQLICGETDEDHAAAVWFNTQLIEYLRWRMAQNEPKAAEKARLALTESEINQRALQKATEIRRRERLLAAAKELDDELTKDARKLAEEVDANRPVPAAQRHLFEDGQLPVAGYAARWINDYDPGNDNTALGFDGTKDGSILKGIVKQIDEHLRVHLDGPPAPPPAFQQPAPLEPGFLKRFGYDSVKVNGSELVQESTMGAALKSVVEANERALELINREPHPSQVSEDGETVTYQVVDRHPTTLERASELRREREAKLWNELPKPWDVTSQQQGPLDPIDRGE